MVHFKITSTDTGIINTSKVHEMRNRAMVPNSNHYSCADQNFFSGEGGPRYSCLRGGDVRGIFSGNFTM